MHIRVNHEKRIYPKHIIWCCACSSVLWSKYSITRCKSFSHVVKRVKNGVSRRNRKCWS